MAHLDKRSILYVSMPDWTLSRFDGNFLGIYEFFRKSFRFVLSCLLAEKSAHKIHLRLWPLVSKKVVDPSILPYFSFAYASALVASLHEWKKETTILASISVADFLDISGDSIVYFFK